MIKTLTFILVTFLWLPLAFSMKSPNDDMKAKRAYRKECFEIKKYAIKSEYSVDCARQYFHFNSSAFKSNYSKSKAKSKGKIRIASYNMLHPGSQRSVLKDIKLMASIINDWDLVVGLELLPVVGRNVEINKRVLKYLKKDPSNSRKLYRAPGYINILNELRKLDKSWALILSPRGDSAKNGQVQEHIGFFYKSSIVKPIENEHCDDYRERSNEIAYACLPNLREAFMDREVSHVFSRRPFLGSFKSGDFDFSLIGSHVIYTSPDDGTKMRDILGPVFGVADYSELGTGINKANYARFAEAGATLDLMNRLRTTYNEDDIIYAADFNLLPTNQYWKEVLSIFPGGKLFQDSPTTVRHGKSTGGLSSSYDHFILDPVKSKECTDSKGEARVAIVNTYEGKSGDYLEKNYIIRSNGGAHKRKKRNEEFKKYLKSLYTVKNGKVVWDDYQFEERLEEYDARIFESQLSDDSYYKYQQEILSDHMPITLDCSTR